MSFTDSFLDFEAMKNWFESVPNLNMSDTEKPVTDGVLEVDSLQETLVPENIVDGSVSISRVEDKEPEMVDSVSRTVEDDVGKVSLVSESVKSMDIISESGANSEIMNVNGEKREALAVTGESGNVIDLAEEIKIVSGGFENLIGIGENCANSEIMDGNGEKSETVGDCGSKIDMIDGNGEKSEAANEMINVVGKKSKALSDEDESESSESESESLSSSSSSSSGCSSSDDEDEEEEEQEEEEEKAGEVEEGEIRDVNFRDVGDDVEAMVDWSDVDDEDDGFKGPIRSKNESKFLPPVPPVDASLLPHHQTLPVGVILSIIGTQVVVEGIEEHSPLSDGSILWMTESRALLGLVDEIFGPVKNPYYIVRYNSESEVPDGISIGDPVSFVPEFASHVLINKDIYKKGYDASGANDEEVSDEAEFSDDEKEAEHRRVLKASKRGTATTDPKPRKSKNNKKSFESRLPQPHFSPLQTLQPVWPNAPPRGAWPNGAPFQHPQGPFFNNGFQTNNNNNNNNNNCNNMMWAPQNPQQFPAYQMQMSMPNGMPFNQQLVNTNQSVPFGQGFAGQNPFNPIPFGLQGQPSLLTSNGLPMGPNFSAPQSGGVQGSNNPPQQFNPGPHGGRESGPYRCGRGRLSRGRGRKQ